MIVRLVAAAFAIVILASGASAQTSVPADAVPAPQTLPPTVGTIPSAPNEITLPAPATAPSALPATPDAPAPIVVDFAAPAAVIDLRTALSSDQVSDPAAPNTLWFTVAIANNTKATVSRVFLADDPPRTSLAVIPTLRHATLTEAAGSDPSIVIERARAFGVGALRISVPPAQIATLALHFQGVSEPPRVLAWTESALIANNRQSALLAGVVAGLLAAAAAFAAGAAALTGNPIAKRGAAFLAALLLADLVAAGAFDNGWLTDFSGPSGLFAFALSLVLAAGLRLVDLIAPFEREARGASAWCTRVEIAILIFGIAALVRVPAAALIIRIVTVCGAALAAGYLAHCGRLGSAEARRMAPAATIFALITAAAAFHALGLLPENLVAPATIGGFSAAGAMLVALGSALMGEGPATLQISSVPQAAESDSPETIAKREEIERASIAASHQGIFDLDLETGRLSLSGEAAAILGLPAYMVELTRENWLGRIHAEDRAVYEKALAAYRHDIGLAFRMEFRARGAGGAARWFELRATMVGQGDEAERCLGLIADVTARKATEAQQLAVVRKDALTGLGNRTAFLDYLEETAGAIKNLSLAIFDLDRFKAVNASLGPEGADAMLREVAARLTERFAARARLYRLGGDMFALVLPSQDLDLAQFGNDILDIMRTPFVAASRDIYLPASVGLASGVHASDALDLLGLAELAMVQAKRDGGECARVYSPDMQGAESAGANGIAGDPLTLESDLRRAIEKGEIEIHYQPIMRMQDRGVAGFEALMRWRNAENGFIDPESFLPQIEETGLILTLGRLALRRAVEDIGQWQQFFPLNPPLFVSVNVSWRQLTDEIFSRDLEELLNGGIAPKSLKLEITERAMLRDVNASHAALKRFQVMGAGLALDDFGTGQSSLAQLRRFPFDVIKIDKSFLSSDNADGKNAILDAIVRLAHDLGLQVVAEGIETEAEANRLRALGCEYGQGYLYGQALPARDVAAFIAMTYARR